MPNRIFIRFLAPVKATSAALNRLSKIISFKIDTLLADPLNQNDHLLLEYAAESIPARYTPRAQIHQSPQRTQALGLIQSKRIVW